MASDKKYFDVSKPGKTMPSSTSRPTIVGHRTLLQDPMMVASAGKTSADEGAGLEPKGMQKPVNTIAPKVQPLAAAPTAPEMVVVPKGKTVVSVTEPQELADTPVPTPDTEPPTEPPTNEPETAATPEVPAAASPEPESAETAEVAADSETTQSADKPTENKETSDADDEESEPAPSEVQTEAQADAAEKASDAATQAVNKLIADKTYFVPVGEKNQPKLKSSRSSMVPVIILVLLLLVVGAYIVIDVGLIDAPFTLPVHLFSQAK